MIVFAIEWAPTRDYATPSQTVVRCASNLRQIAQALSLYAANNGGRYPDQIEELVSDDLGPDVFVCVKSRETRAVVGPTTRATMANVGAGGHVSYVYMGRGMSEPMPVGTVVAHEPVGNHPDAPGVTDGANVLFADGHVAFVPAGVVTAMEGELKAGRNPPATVKGY